MPKICYTTKKFADKTLLLIHHANEIIERYARQGYDMTVRQVYYQMIAKDLFPDTWIDKNYNLRNGLDPNTKNTIKNYKNFGGILSDARRAGLIDWNHIVDRRRGLLGYGFYENMADYVNSLAPGYYVDRWENQPRRVEVWVEKDALIGVIGRACGTYQLPHFSCAGYNSDSEMWRAAQRLKSYIRNGYDPVIIQLSDHDPSGIDMERDVSERLTLLSGGYEFPVHRVALTMKQIEEVNAPPNPAKETDARFSNYRDQFGDESWELDALEPQYLNDLITDTIEENYLDSDLWNDKIAEEEEARKPLYAITNNWQRVVQETTGRQLINRCSDHPTATTVRRKDRNWGCGTCGSILSIEWVAE